MVFRLLKLNNMIRKVIIPHTKEDLIIQLPEKFMDVEIEINIFPVQEIKNSDFEEEKENHDLGLTQLSDQSFGEIWDTPENNHWDEFLTAKI